LKMEIFQPVMLVFNGVNFAVKHVGWIFPTEQCCAGDFESTRVAYLAQDRPDSGQAVKNLARKMLSPTEGSMSDLKRLVRYVKK